MTERERWIVYPLLFLALGAALRDKLGGSTKTKSIVCQELRIEDEPSGNQPARTLAVIRGTEPTAESPAIGVLQITGEIEVAGAVKVDGIVNANQYACQGIILTPAFEMMERILRALQAAQGQSQANPKNALPAPARRPAQPSTPPPVDDINSKAASSESDAGTAGPK
jgi:hypothetical protein